MSFSIYFHVARNPVYPPCTSLRRIRCFYSFCRLVESISYVESVGVRIPTPPASTISDKEMVSRACRGAPSDQGNGVPSLPRGTFPRRKWCPELVEGHLPTKEMVSRACRGAPSHEGNGVPSLPRGTFRQGNGVPSLSRGTFPRRKW